MEARDSPPLPTELWASLQRPPWRVLNSSSAVVAPREIPWGQLNKVRDSSRGWSSFSEAALLIFWFFKFVFYKWIPHNG